MNPWLLLASPLLWVPILIAAQALTDRTTP